MKHREAWQLQALDVCTEAAGLHARLVLLTQSVPSSAQWSDEEAWSAGRRDINRLSLSIEELESGAPKGRGRDGLSDLLAVLHALHVTIGDDPDARARPARASSIPRRLRDLQSATSSLRRLAK